MRWETNPCSVKRLPLAETGKESGIRLKWMCFHCKAINPQFSYDCHNCDRNKAGRAITTRRIVMVGSYIKCPHCKDEDASEETETQGRTKHSVTCRTCAKEFKAKFDHESDRWTCETIKG